MGECAKRNCSYYWQDENDDYPRCHFESWGPAPCEEDDWYEEEEEEEEEEAEKNAMDMVMALTDFICEHCTVND